jgi:TldD protein
MNWNLQKLVPQLSGYAEVRAQQNDFLTLSLINGELTTNSNQQQTGLSVRSFHHGSWGFASSPLINADSAGRLTKEAEANARALAKVNKNTFELPHLKGTKYTQQNRTTKQKLTTSGVIDQLKRIDDFVKTKYPKVNSRQLTLRQQDFAKQIINTEAADLNIQHARSHLYVILGAESKNGPVTFMTIFGGPGNVEDNLPNQKEMEEKIDLLVKRLMDKADGIRPEAGYKDVILDSKLAGILAHEAVGHTTEADLVRAGSIAGETMNEMVASPIFNLVDFAHHALGEECLVPVYVDDEGTPGEDTWIIKEGRLLNFMHNKETASLYNSKATGHARAWNFNDEPLIRMRNTAILPGHHSLNEMISSIEDGYYLIDHSNGQADSTSEFMFGVTMGYEIKKGKLGKALLDTTIAGVAFDMLKTVSMVSNEMYWVDSGTCGKKQPMFVSMGGPAVKCKINVGGV